MRIGIALFSLCLFVTANAQELEPSAEHLCAHAKTAHLRAMLAQHGTLTLPVGVRDGLEDTDVLHYHLDLLIDPGLKRLDGSNTMTVRSAINGLTSFQFRLSSTFTIGALTVGGQSVSWQRLDPATIEVMLDRPYGEDEIFELYVEYAGTPNSGNWGSIEFRTQSGQPLVYTLSQPWFAYTWWPAKDDLYDKTTADLWFTVPDTLKVASNGRLQSVEEVGLGWLQYRWRTDYPTADYLYCFGATNYDTFGTTWEYGEVEMPLEFYIYPASNNLGNRTAWLKNVEMLTVFSDLYGLYPFTNEKYGMCQVGFSGGMEHQTMTSQGGFWEYITAHELSHQWWGDNVTCATWHDIWLNEGFATYSEALYYENRPGSSGEPALHSYMSGKVPSNPSGTVYVYDISNPDWIFSYNTTYLKAGWVLHMLRHVLGDAVFFDALAAHRAAHGGGVATTSDFQNVVEQTAGRDLDWFFAQWIYEGGIPNYRFGWREVTVGGQAYLELYLLQTQSAQYPIFTMPIDLQVTESSEVRTYTAWNDAQREHVLLPLTTGGVSSVLLDPKPWILKSAQTTAFVPGPPKVVELTPAPGEAVKHVPELKVTFHKPVQVAAQDLALVGVRNGPIATSFVYEPASQTATLTPLYALTSDTYTLTVSEAIVDVESQQALDGELDKPFVSAPLPSGDGLPGGATIATFALVAAGDMNCDGEVDFGDINPFVKALADPVGYVNEFPGCPVANGDINEDGKVDFEDINPFITLLTGP